MKKVLLIFLYLLSLRTFGVLLDGIYIAIPLDDNASCAKEVAISGNYGATYPNGGETTGAFFFVDQSDGFQGSGYQTVVTLAGTPTAYSLNVNIAPYNNSGAKSATFSEQWSGGLYSAGPFSYSAYGDACGGGDGNGFGQATENSNVSTGYTNNTAAPQQITTTDGQQITLQPGQGTTNLTISYNDGTGSGGYSVSSLNPNTGQYNDDGTITLSNVTGFNGSTVTNGQGQSGSLTTPNYGAYATFLASSNGAPIIWSTNMSAQQVDQAGFNDLGEILLQNQAQNNSNLLNLYNQLHSGIPVTVNGGTNLEITNNVSIGSYSNSFVGASNVWVMNWPSNLIGNVNFTNGVAGSNVWVQNWPSNFNLSGATDGSLSMLGLLPSWQTNYSALTNYVGQNMPNYGLISWVNSLSPSFPSDTDPGMTDWTINILGNELNFDPEVQMPGVCAACRAAWVVILVFWFLYWLSEKWFQTARTIPSMRGGTIPDMEVSAAGEFLGIGGQVGGNFIGVAIFYLLVTLMLSAITICGTWFFSNAVVYVSSYLASGLNVSAVFGQLGNDAVHLLVIMFPVSMFFGLLFARIVINFSLGGVIMFAQAVCRLIPIG